MLAILEEINTPSSDTGIPNTAYPFAYAANAGDPCGPIVIGCPLELVGTIIGLLSGPICMGRLTLPGIEIAFPEGPIFTQPLGAVIVTFPELAVITLLTGPCGPCGPCVPFSPIGPIGPIGPCGP
jgi:hypothetical protein